jgi:large subunit ribosomal protein L15
MPARKQKKSKKYRGSKTHGKGSMKRRRGKGNKGGKGMSGSGKRADQKKPLILKLYGPSYFGKKGFYNPTGKEIKIINIDYVEQHIDSLVKAGIASHEQGTYSLNLGKIGVQKLLGTGKPTRKYHITVAQVSESAKEKIEEKGGRVDVQS